MSRQVMELVLVLVDVDWNEVVQVDVECWELGMVLNWGDVEHSMVGGVLHVAAFSCRAFHETA